jgi:hypothetical protein
MSPDSTCVDLLRDESLTSDSGLATIWGYCIGGRQHTYGSGQGLALDSVLGSVLQFIPIDPNTPRARPEDCK